MDNATKLSMLIELNKELLQQNVLKSMEFQTIFVFVCCEGKLQRVGQSIIIPGCFDRHYVSHSMPFR